MGWHYCEPLHVSQCVPIVTVMVSNCTVTALLHDYLWHIICHKKQQLLKCTWGPPASRGGSSFMPQAGFGLYTNIVLSVGFGLFALFLYYFLSFLNTKWNNCMTVYSLSQTLYISHLHDIKECFFFLNLLPGMLLSMTEITKSSSDSIDLTGTKTSAECTMMQG